jgi:prepilin-type processing-associated H-X9-DG protein
LNFGIRHGNDNDWANNNGFMSRHRNGANFCLVDGSVRFVSESIDLSLYRSLATISGGELNGEY